MLRGDIHYWCLLRFKRWWEPLRAWNVELLAYWKSVCSKKRGRRTIVTKLWDHRVQRRKGVYRLNSSPLQSAQPTTDVQFQWQPPPTPLPAQASWTPWLDPKVSFGVLPREMVWLICNLIRGDTGLFITGSLSHKSLGDPIADGGSNIEWKIVQELQNLAEDGVCVQRDVGYQSSCLQCHRC